MLWNTNIEVVQAWRAWYFSHVKSVKGRREIHIHIPGEPGNEVTPGRAPHVAADGLGMRLGKDSVPNLISFWPEFCPEATSAYLQGKGCCRVPRIAVDHMALNGQHSLSTVRRVRHGIGRVDMNML